MKKIKLYEDEAIDDLQLKGLGLIQKKDAFRFGVDAVLLSQFARIKRNFRVIDLCTGTGIVPFLIMGKFSPQEIYGIEIQEEMAEMAQRSSKLNDLENTVKFFNKDLKDIDYLKSLGKFDALTVNPPYKLNNSGIVNSSDKLAIARHEIMCSLEDVIVAARTLLKDNGRMYMVHRPERLADIITLMRKYKIEPKRIRMVHPNTKKAPNIVLVEGQRDGGQFLKWEPPLYVYKDEGGYSDEIDLIYGRRETLMKQGKVYLVPTPIGNLKDITLRALEVLKAVDVIAAEDTRQTLKLLNHFEIKKSLISYHQHNEQRKSEEILDIVKDGKDIAIVTDAGTPGISDPGAVLVQKCIENNIEFYVLPGATAITTAVVYSGLDTTKFLFRGFIPRETKERKILFDEIKESKETLVFYESPHRLLSTLEFLKNNLGNRKIAACRELTKLHEEIIRGSIQEVIDSFSERGN